ncbi:MAG TPA: hypothetical protein VMP03_06175 [Methylomirabilota bacterium]|nr:hypothetical protein [Methylomirabilota bacterium]
MADYYPVLKRAISSLPSSSGEARRIVYEKARAALLKQLQSYNPPLSPSDVTEQRLALEECIRRIEGEVAGVAFGLPPEQPAAPPPPPPPPIDRLRAPPSHHETSASEEGPDSRGYDDEADSSREEPAFQAREERPPIEPLAPPVATVQRPMPTAQPRQGPPPPPPSAPPEAATDPRIGAGMSALSKTLRQADSLGGASAQAVRTARDAIEDGGEEVEPPADEKIEPNFLDAPLGEREPPPRRQRESVVGQDSRAQPDDRARRLESRRRSTSPPREARQRRSFAVPIAFGIVVLALAGTAAIAYIEREQLIAMWADLTEGQPEAPLIDAAAPPEPDDGLEPKILDRLPQDGDPATPVAPDAREVQTVDVDPPVDADFPPPPGAEPPATETPTAPLEPATPEVATAPEPPPPADAGSGVLVEQRAILYEEPIPGSDGARVDGRVIWSLVNEPVLPGEPAVAQVRAVVEVPARGMTLTLSIRRNTDDALPASHVVEAKFDLPADFEGRAIDTTPGLILKETEDARGDPLVGAVAKVADNLFWVALSGSDQEAGKNLGLLRDRQWIDVPIRYGNRRRAILTFEKGAPGDRVFEQALQAWGN